MTTEQIEVLDSIHRLARTINAELNEYVSCTEHMHEPGVENDITVMICTGHNGETYTFHRIEGIGWNGESGTIPQARDELASWLADARKRKEAA